MAPSYRDVSFWLDSLPEGDPMARPPLDGSIDTDVVIVGAGYTGMWAAYYLTELEPEIDVTIVESEIAGFGASGRNGGWSSGELYMHHDRHSPAEISAMFRAVWDAIDEIGRVTEREGIDCHRSKGGSILLVTSEAQKARAEAGLRRMRELGFGDDDFRWLGSDETRLRVRSDKAIASVYTPHCAAIHPARLARGLATVLEARGVKIFERTKATSIEPGVVRTDRGDVRAPTVLRCVEAFGATMPGGRRDVVPIYSLMIATEPLSEEVWDEIGLVGRETFHDGRHLIIYGQRTKDDRFAFGGRGAPYHFGSTLKPEYERNAHTHAAIAGTLRWLFPQIGEAQITHTWGGAVAVPRDWTSSVAFDPTTRVGRAGGYVGAGVTPSNLAGRTLADLALGRETDRAHLAWVGHRSRLWEPEPLRWAGINLGRSLAPLADSLEFKTGRPSRFLGGVLEYLTGH